MMTTLEEVGVKPIEAVGKEFDPNLHNAVMHDENDEMDENILGNDFSTKESVLTDDLSYGSNTNDVEGETEEGNGENRFI